MDLIDHILRQKRKNLRNVFSSVSEHQPLYECYLLTIIIIIIGLMKNNVIARELIKNDQKN